MKHKSVGYCLARQAMVSFFVSSRHDRQLQHTSSCSPRCSLSSRRVQASLSRAASPVDMAKLRRHYKPLQSTLTISTTCLSMHSAHPLLQRTQGLSMQPTCQHLLHASARLLPHHHVQLSLPSQFFIRHNQIRNMLALSSLLHLTEAKLYYCQHFLLTFLPTVTTSTAPPPHATTCDRLQLHASAPCSQHKLPRLQPTFYTTQAPAPCLSFCQCCLLASSHTKTRSAHVACQVSANDA